MNFLVDSHNIRGVAIARELRRIGEKFDIIERDNRRAFHGRSCETLYFAAGTVLERVAHEDPGFDFRSSVLYSSYHLHEIRSKTFVLLSSVAVYPNVSSEETTREDQPLLGPSPSVFAFHKRLTEDMVRQFAPNHLIIRLPSVVGVGLDGSPVLEALSPEGMHAIARDSELNVVHADSMARNLVAMVSAGVRGTVNLAATDTIAGSQIPELLGAEIDFAPDRPGELIKPRISVEKAGLHCQLQSSREAFGPRRKRNVA